MSHDTADQDGTKMRNAPAAGQAGDQASPDTGTGGGGENRSSRGEAGDAAAGRRNGADDDGRGAPVRR